MAAMNAVVAIAVICSAFVPAPISVVRPPADNSGQGDVATIPNPLGVGGPPGDLLVAIKPFTDGAVLPFVLLALAAAVVRFAHSSGTERLQLKWFAYGASFSLVLFVLALVLGLSGIDAGLVPSAAGLSLALIPVGAGIAILRYRLYDIDLLINRTLVYGATSAGLLATYVLSVLALSTLLRPLTGSSELAVAGSTLAVVALFGPLRRRIQDAVDRRFSRSRYDAERTLDAFSVRLRDEVDLEAVRADLLGAVRDTVRPAHASVWLRERER